MPQAIELNGIFTVINASKEKAAAWNKSILCCNAAYNWHFEHLKCRRMVPLGEARGNDILYFVWLAAV
jgi:hypothetical protein